MNISLESQFSLSMKNEIEDHGFMLFKVYIPYPINFIGQNACLFFNTVQLLLQYYCSMFVINEVEYEVVLFL